MSRNCRTFGFLLKKSRKNITIKEKGYSKGLIMAGTSIIRSKDVYNIIRKTLGIMDVKVMQHGEVTAYFLYKMLQADGTYGAQELADYTMIGMMHDIGMIKTGYAKDMVERETKGVWAHSIYGYLFLRYLSPIGDKAEIVLYHHLPYRLHNLIKSQYLKITEYLSLADKMDMFLHAEGHDMGKDYFVKNVNVEFSPRAVEIFNKAQAKFHLMEHLKDGSYLEELDTLLTNAHFPEKYKKGFLEMLIYSIDFRSQQTVVHTLATTTFALELGRLMRVPTKDLQVLYYGALLHDIGKIAIPLDILEAPRRLTDEEMRVMKAHVIISEKILRGVIDEEVLEVAIRHHEKLDGTGYHRGLKGEELTRLQRTVAVADILSALYGKRSYKDSFDPEKIKSILRGDAQAGKICPKIVDFAVGNFDSIIRNYEKQRTNTLGIYETILEQYDIIYERFKIYE